MPNLEKFNKIAEFYIQDEKIFPAAYNSILVLIGVRRFSDLGLVSKNGIRRIGRQTRFRELSGLFSGFSGFAYRILFQNR